MRHISHTKTVTINNQTWWVNSRSSGLYSDMLQKMLNQLFVMLEYHSKVHVIRFDLHQPTYTETNNRITQFNRRLFKWIKSNYEVKRIGYIWVREQETSKQQHYHYALILNGHKVNYPQKIIQRVGEIWERMSGTDYTPKNCFYNIGQDEDTLQDAVYRISYLPKARGKGYRPDQTKDYSTSRLKSSQC